MRIKTRLIIGLIILFALVVGQTALAISYVNRLSGISTELANAAMVRAENVERLSTALAEHRGAELGYILGSRYNKSIRPQQDLESLWDGVGVFLLSYRRSLDDPQTIEEFEQVTLNVDDYARYRQRILAMTDEGLEEEARTLFTSYQDEFDQMMDQVHELRRQEFEGAMILATEARNSAARFWYVFAITTLVVTAAEVGLGWYIWRSVSGGLGRLVEGTRRVSQGDLSSLVPVKSRDEMGELALSFNTMLRTLKESQDENARLTRESIKMEEEHVRLFRESLVETVRAQEEERKRVARELHDQTGQALTSLHLGLGQLERSQVSPKVKEHVRSLRDLTLETMEEVRNLALDLRPAALDELGLVPALRGYLRDVSERSGIPVKLEVDGMRDRLSSEMEVALFRTIQEGLTNILKHSQASQALVSISLVSNRVLVMVEDNGVGFNVAQVLGSTGRRALGLFGIEERVGLLGGDLQIQSEEGKGTKLKISVPPATPNLRDPTE